MVETASAIGWPAFRILCRVPIEKSLYEGMMLSCWYR
jgi:hypothetical protein